MLWTGDDTRPRRPGAPGRWDSPTSAADAVAILVVDDDEWFCAAVARALASLPFRTFSVATAGDALRFLAGAPPFDDAPRPAFVVLDFNLPDLNAPAVLADLRNDPRIQQIPVLVLTQIPGATDEATVLQAGARAYLGALSTACLIPETLGRDHRRSGVPT
jgi:CheY-like chemotaxis protein